jgi:hypothetical protein
VAALDRSVGQDSSMMAGAEDQDSDPTEVDKTRFVAIVGLWLILDFVTVASRVVDGVDRVSCAVVVEILGKI